MQKSLFSIHRLSELKESTEDMKRGGIVHIYFVLKGCLTIAGGRVMVKAGTLYWICSEKRPVCKITEETEGYVLHFSKGGREELCWSFLAAFGPFPGKGEKIPVTDAFLNEGRMLCEMMLEENKCTSFFKMEVLRGLLSLFLLHLFRRSEIVLFAASGNPEVSIAERGGISLSGEVRAGYKIF